ncbi:MAG: LacI family DNA-binding transcriptional regulator [Spirochaetaceae bacterium]|nr:MAG: LacI family DNA-binding transcriptional regulator [Spirochaetaceae bacterium]
MSDGRKKPASIKEVALLAGVSVSTVSHVINDTRFVSPSTRSKVLEAIEKLNYKPNIMAQGIKGWKSRTVGLIVTHLAGSFFDRLVNSVCSFMHAQGYDVLVCNSEEAIEQERRHIDVLLRRGIDGLIYAPVDPRITYDALLSRPVPFVQIERKNESYNSDFIHIDDYRESLRIASRFVGRGCRRIGFLRHGTENYPGRKYEGYVQACIDGGIFDPELAIKVSHDLKEARATIREWFVQKWPMDALLCTNSNICYTVLQTLNELGYESYRRLTLFSFENNRWLSLLEFPVLACDQPIEEIGRTASEVLLRRITGDPSPPQDYLLECGISEH